MNSKGQISELLYASVLVVGMAAIIMIGGNLLTPLHSETGTSSTLGETVLFPILAFLVLFTIVLLFRDRFRTQENTRVG